MLSGQQTIEFTGRHIRFRASVTLRDQARLIFRDSLVESVLDFAHQHGLTAYDDSQVVVERSDLLHEQPGNWDFRGRARLTMTDVRKIGTNPNPWMTFADDTLATVRDSEFDATVWDRGALDIASSPSVYLELVFPASARVDASLTERLASFTFPGPDERNISYRVNIRDTVMRGWGITMLPASDITLRDAHNVVVTLQANTPWEDKTIELEDLKAQRYADRTVRFGDSALRLVNVDVWQWSPTAFRNNTLIVRRSDLADIAFVGNDARIIIEQCEAYFLRARENVQMTVRDSLIYSDVIATDNSVITLINTQVRGKIVQEGNGRVIRR